MCSNDDTRDANIDRTRKATTFYTRGKLGKWIDKRTEILEFDKKIEDIRGSMLVDTIITRIIQMTNEVVTMNTTDYVKDNIYTYFAEDANHFNTVRRTEITQALISVLDRPNKSDNDIQRLTDIDTTPHACREIKYTKCITKHIDLVIADCGLEE